jgi:hypothetical protein
MRADFGFNPAESHATLPWLLAPAGPWRHVPAFGQHGAAFPWGYNGPYWQGPVSSGHPVDAWGQPIDLIYGHGAGTWQLHSPGAPGRHQDLYYPPTPASVSSYNATVLVSVTRLEPELSGKVILKHAGNAGSQAGELILQTHDLDPEAELQSFVFTAPAGSMELLFVSTVDRVRPRSMAMDLLPGETREVAVRL